MSCDARLRMVDNTGWEWVCTDGGSQDDRLNHGQLSEVIAVIEHLHGHPMRWRAETMQDGTAVLSGWDA